MFVFSHRVAHYRDLCFYIHCRYDCPFFHIVPGLPGCFRGNTWNFRFLFTGAAQSFAGIPCFGLLNIWFCIH